MVLKDRKTVVVDIKPLTASIKLGEIIEYIF